MASRLAKTLAGALPLVALARADIISGKLVLVPSTDLTAVDPANSIGCLGATGLLTQADCATFSWDDSSAGTLSSTAGVCTFADEEMPTNDDAVYGALVHALKCGESEADPSIFYKISVSRGLVSRRRVSVGLKR
jgi:hypothetical protein